LIKVRLAPVRDRVIYGKGRIRRKGEPIPLPEEDDIQHNKITARPEPNGIYKAATIIPMHSRCELLEICS
jgi:hypothetical protein